MMKWMAFGVSLMALLASCGRSDNSPESNYEIRTVTSARAFYHATLYCKSGEVDLKYDTVQSFLHVKLKNKKGENFTDSIKILGFKELYHKWSCTDYLCVIKGQDTSVANPVLLNDYLFFAAEHNGIQYYIHQFHIDWDSLKFVSCREYWPVGVATITAQTKQITFMERVYKDKGNGDGYVGSNEEVSTTFDNCDEN